MNILVTVSLNKLLGGGVLAGTPLAALIEGWSLQPDFMFLDLFDPQSEAGGML